MCDQVIGSAEGVVAELEFEPEAVAQLHANIVQKMAQTKARIGPWLSYVCRIRSTLTVLCMPNSPDFAR
jgi:hypothetical protein